MENFPLMTLFAGRIKEGHHKENTVSRRRALVHSHRYVLQGFDSPVTWIALVAGMILLFIGCFSWAYKLHWYAGRFRSCIWSSFCNTSSQSPLTFRIDETSPSGSVSKRHRKENSF